jgi:hypothetical protein
MLRRRKIMKRDQFSAFKNPLARLSNLYQFFNHPTWMLASRSPVSSNLCQVLPQVSSDLRQAPGHEISDKQLQSPSSLSRSRRWGNWMRFIFCFERGVAGHDRGKPCHYYRLSEAIPVWDRSGAPRGSLAKNALHPSPFGDLPGWAE